MKTLALIAALVAVLLGFNSMFVVQEQQVGVLFQFGRIVRTDIQPGLHFKMPMVQEVRTFDRWIMTLDSQPEPYLTNEKKDVNVDFFAKWRIRDVGAYYIATQGDQQRVLSRLNPIVKEALRNEINQRTLQSVVASERTNMSETLIAIANEATTTLGIEVVDIRIKRLDLPDQVSESVFQRMRAERLRVANELRSEGNEAAERIRANADRERQVILANAERDAQRLRGEGDAEAARIYAEAYNSDAEFYGFYRSLEAYRQSFRGGDGVLVLDPDSEFFRYFDEAGGSR